MSLEERRNLIADELIVISEDIKNLETKPSKFKVGLLIDELYQVMRQLSDYQESGY